ncbi:hypothetical protein NPIL_94141 [Nephila pilipes]|uniref:Uncharacterized protein n=1 Tax=Nephila pilipes TaxID=299642 RepID=A0A8X6TTC2_NEPPI|nr:hypothetical protein NPIL_94141 [Nephila pilipes]
MESEPMDLCMDGLPQTRSSDGWRYHLASHDPRLHRKCDLTRSIRPVNRLSLIEPETNLRVWKICPWASNCPSPLQSQTDEQFYFYVLILSSKYSHCMDCRV